MDEKDTLSKIDRAREKLRRVPIKIPIHSERTTLPKPAWAKVRLGLDRDGRVQKMKHLLRDQGLVTVCEEASCPNLHECFSKGTATFMIMGDKCTRRCTFCDVGHGRPDPLDPKEPSKLAQTIARLDLDYVVITSVDRDDLKDGGAQHFVDCIAETRRLCPKTKIEVLVPDFRGRSERALGILSTHKPDVFNHNIETVPSLYKQARPGSSYQHSLALLASFKAMNPEIATKSGMMLGLGETDDEVVETLKDLRAHQVDMVTIGQYLAPSQYHTPVMRYVTPEQYKSFGQIAQKLGFSNVASGFMVRSSYHADLQAEQKHLEIDHA